MDLAFAINVSGLAKKGMPVPGIASVLGCTETEVMAALTALGEAIPGEPGAVEPKPGVVKDWRKSHGREGT